MALSVTIKSRRNVGNQVVVTADVNLNTYAAGGIAATPATFGLTRIDNVELPMKLGYVFEYDYSAQKIMARYTGAAVSTALAEVGAVDLSVTPGTFRIDVWGA